MLLLCFLFPFPLKTPLKVLPPLQSRHVSFSFLPSHPGQKGVLRRELKTQITFTKKIHLSGFTSAELGAWQAPPWPQFWQGDGGDPSREGSHNPFQHVFQLRPKQGAAWCPALPGACAREASASGQAQPSFWAPSCPRRRGTKPAGLSSCGETALKTSIGGTGRHRSPWPLPLDSVSRGPAGIAVGTCSYQLPASAPLLLHPACPLQIV